MRIIKFIKNYALGFILAAVFVGPFSYVTATTIAARNITYNGTNTNSSLTDVQTAIETLYTMSEGKPLISFTVDGVSYQAEEGMTWDEFINNSKYSLSQFTLLDDQAAKNGKRIYQSNQITCACSDNTIIENHNYFACGGNCEPCNCGNGPVPVI